MFLLCQFAEFIVPNSERSANVSGTDETLNSFSDFANMVLNKFKAVSKTEETFYLLFHPLPPMTC
jgi:hypothetical protein